MNVTDKETTTSGVEQGEIFAQTVGNTKEVPGLIKKLTAGVVFLFVVSVCMIFVEASLYHGELKRTKDWFQLAEYYGLRYVMLSFLASSPMIYTTYRNVGDSDTLANYCKRTVSRIERAYDFNIKARSYLEKLELSYDYRPLQIQTATQTFNSSFTYSMITVRFPLLR